jgi:hypothetical protein
MAGVNFNNTTNLAANEDGSTPAGAGGGGGSGIIRDIEISTLVSDFEFTSTSFVDTGLSVTVTVETGDIVELKFLGNISVWLYNSVDPSIYIAYQVGASPEVVRTIVTPRSELYAAYNLSFSQFITGLSAGAHTIKIRARVGSAGNTRRLIVAGTSVPTLQAAVMQSASQVAAINKLITWSPQTQTFTSTSYANITNVANISVDFPETGNYIFQLNVAGPYVLVADNSCTFGLVIDDGTPVDYPLLPAPYFASGPRWNGLTNFVETTVSSGTRNVRIQLKITNNVGGRALQFNTDNGFYHLKLVEYLNKTGQ